MTRQPLPSSFIIPEEPELKDVVLQEYLEEIALAVNSIPDLPTVGSSSLPTPPAPSPPAPSPPAFLTQTIDCGALPNRTHKFVTHNIPFTAQSEVLRIYGIATNPGVAWMNVPFADPLVLAYGVAMVLFSKQLLVLTAVDYSRFSKTLVTVEYTL